MQQRWCLPRQQRQLSTVWGPVRIKEAELPDGSRRSKPEFEDLAALARAHGLSLRQVRDTVLLALASDNPDPRSEGP